MRQLTAVRARVQRMPPLTRPPAVFGMPANQPVVSVRAFADEHLRGRADEDLEVHPDALALDVGNIELEAIVKIQVAAAVNLPQPGDAGHHFESLGVP